MELNIKVQYSSGVILLSIGIAFIGAYVGIVLFEQFRLCQKDKRPKLLNKHSLMWLIATSIGGVSIW
jgi:NO-binding membrane sensor protein with MHYT domain